MGDLKLFSTDVLLVIDPQVDFCPGGKLAVMDGDAVMPVINRVAARFEHVIVTQDWHPAEHGSFASSHPGHGAYESIAMPYGPQTLWPDHCVQGSPGAEFHPALELERMKHVELILRKGFRPEIDSYSAFYENDHVTPTGLAGYLRERGLRRVFLAGLAYDFCVRYSAVDAVKAGFEAVVLEDACQAIDLRGANGESTVETTQREFAEAGVTQRYTSALP
ncbi:MAG TPA: bifunctional nicotinamidase/pyrazinamidase [Acidobacteriaceae bacterium]